MRAGDTWDTSASSELLYRTVSDFAQGWSEHLRVRFKESGDPFRVKADAPCLTTARKPRH